MSRCVRRTTSRMRPTTPALRRSISATGPLEHASPATMSARLSGSFPARKLHSMQAIRAANHTLQTADPSGINAAGPGSNVGQSVVYNYAGEILRTAWDRTSHPRYFAALEEKAEKMLAVQPRYSDDMSHRIEFFKRFFPHDYVAQNHRAREIQQQLSSESRAASGGRSGAKGRAAPEENRRRRRRPAFRVSTTDCRKKRQL